MRRAPQTVPLIVVAVHMLAAVAAFADVTVTASSGDHAERAADGDTATYWHTSEGISWLELEYDSAKTIEAVVFLSSVAITNRASGQVQSYSVEYWDGGAYKEVIYAEKGETTVGWIIATFVPVQTTRVRLNLSMDGWILRVREIQPVEQGTPRPLLPAGTRVLTARYDGVFPPARATDGDPGTRCPLWDESSFVELDYGAARTIEGVVFLTRVLMGGRRSGQVEAYSVEYWDGAAYQEVTYLEKGETTVGWIVASFEPVDTTRVRLSLRMGGVELHVHEVQAIEQGAPEPWLPAGTRVLTAYYDGVFPPALATDGDPGTRCPLWDETSFVELDYDASKTIEGLVFLTRVSIAGRRAGQVEAYSVEYWDGAAYQEVTHLEKGETAAGWIVTSFEPVDTTRVRLNLRMSGVELHIYEVQPIERGTPKPWLPAGTRVLAAHYDPVYPPAFATDGDPSTRCPLWDETSFVELDHDAAKTIEGLVFLTRVSIAGRRAGQVGDYSVEYWDGAAYQEVTYLEKGETAAGWIVTSFEPVDTTRVRLNLRMAGVELRIHEVRPIEQGTPKPWLPAGTRVLAAHYDPVFPPAYAADGIEGTYSSSWHASGSDAWIELDYDSAKTVAGVRFLSWGIDDYEIVYWDGAAYQDVLYVEKPIATAYVWTAVTFDPVATTRIGMNVCVSGHMRMYEFQAAMAPSNRPPVAEAGDDQVVEQECYAGASVTLDGSGSSDPDEYPLTYTWDTNGDGEFDDATGPTPTVILSLGQHEIGLRVTDPGGLSDEDTVTVTVVDSTPPALAAPGGVTAEQASADGTSVDIGEAMATDICDADVEITNDALAIFPLGETVVTWTAIDDSGNMAMATQTVTVEDTAPVEIQSAWASPAVLWPPNHKMRSVTVEAVLDDICDAAPTYRIVGVTSNEPIDGKGDGHTEPDWETTGDYTLNLRAERSGGGTGRIYTITIEAADASGNTSTRTVEVLVPHDQGGGDKPGKKGKGK